MSGPIKNLEAVVDGEVKFPPLTDEQKQRISHTLGELASIDALGLSMVLVPEQTHVSEQSNVA